MAANDIVTRIIFDDADAIKGMKNVADATDTAKKSVEELNDANSRIGKDMSTSLNVGESALGSLRNSIEDAREAQSGLGKETGDLGKRFGEFGKGVQVSMAGATAGTGALRVGLASLKAALISTGIGAFVVLVGTLVSKFIQSETAANLYNSALETMGIRSKSARLAQEALNKAIEDFKRPSAALAQATTLLIAKMKNQGDESGAAAFKLLSLRTELAKAEAEAIKLSDQLQTQAKITSDVGKKTDVYKDAVAETSEKLAEAQGFVTAFAIAVENEIFAQSQSVEVKKKVVKVTDDQIEATDKLIEKMLKAEEIRRRIIDSLEDELKAAALINEQGFIDLEQNEKDRLTLQIEFDKKLAEAKFDDFQERLIALKLSTEETKLFLKQAEIILYNELEIITLEGEAKLAAARAKARVPAGGFLITGEAAKDGGSSSAEDNDKKIQKNAREAARAIRDVDKLVSGVLDGITDLTDKAIEENDRYIQSLQDRRDELESVLEDELSLREQGLANNVTGAQKELDALQAQEEAAARKQEELEKKRTKQQLLQDQLKFVSQIGLAVASLIAAEASKGIIGLVIAATAIPFLFKLIAGAKAQSETLHEGGPVGTAGTPWRSDRYGRGHRVEDSNLVLGGDEFVINGRTTSKHRGFLEQLNAGYFDNMNLAASMNQGFRKRDSTIQQRQGKRNQEMLNRAMSNAMHVHSSEMIQFMAKQGQYYSYTPGDTVVHVTPTQIKSTRK